MCSETLPSTFCSTWWMWPFSTVTDPNGRSSAIACAESEVPQPHGSQIVHIGMWARTTIGVDGDAAGEIRLQPGELLVAERSHRARLEVQGVGQADEMDAALVEAVPRATLAVVIEELEIAGDAVVDRVVLARHRVHAVDLDLGKELARAAELVGLGEVTDVAGVDDERRRCGKAWMSAIARRRLPTTSGLASRLNPMCVSLIWTKVRSPEPAAAVGPEPVAPSALGTPPLSVHTTAVALQAERHFSASLRSGLGSFIAHSFQGWTIHVCLTGSGGDLFRNGRNSHLRVGHGNKRSRSTVVRNSREMWMAMEQDHARFESLAMPHLNAAYNLARWLTHNDHDAEDVVHESVIRAMRYIGSFRGDSARALAVADRS